MIERGILAYFLIPFAGGLIVVALGIVFWGIFLIIQLVRLIRQKCQPYPPIQ